MKTMAYLSVLLFASIMILGPTLGQAEARTEYDSILRIATQAHEEIKVQLSRSDSVRADVEEMFREGTDELDALKEAIQNEDPESAKRHFLLAMGIFKKISQMDSETSSPATGFRDDLVRHDLKSKLDRTEGYFIKLKNIATTHGADVDFLELDQLFDLAKQQFSEGDYEGTKESIKEIKGLISDIKEKLKESSQAKASDRAKQFAQKYLEKLDALIIEATELDYPPEVVEKLKAAKEKLSQSSDPRQIIEEIKQILSIKEQLDLSRFNKIISQANQIEQQINELVTMEKIDSVQAGDMMTVLAELRTTMDDRNYDVAESVLKNLTDTLDTLGSTN